jgi:hypothetical protein
MGGDDTSFGEVFAGVSATLATYTHALDDGRTDDVVATYCTDGSCDIPGLGHHVGHASLLAAYREVEPKRPQRHLILNTEMTAWDDAEVHATSDVVFLLKSADRWAIRLVGRYRDVLHRDGQTWRFHRREAEFTA